MKTATDLAKMVKAQSDIIISALTEKEISTYQYLETGYPLTDVSVDERYVRKFRDYYQIRFTSNQYVDSYFDLLQQQQSSPLTFTGLARQLYQIDGRHQLAFISKLLHTADDSQPIYDRHVGAACGIVRCAGTIEKRIREDAALLQHLSNTYRSLEEQGLLNDIIRAFDSRFPNNGISFVKKVDFLLRQWHRAGRNAAAGPPLAEIKPGCYRHFKGQDYQVLHIATHSETREPLVIYRALYGDRGIFARPVSMWLEEVTRDGITCKRFTYLGK